MKKCDMCGSEINEDGRCECGVWMSAEEHKNHIIKLAIENFHEMKRFTLTSDAPQLGCAVIFFRGDYKDCKKVQEFIYTMKARPYYQEE